MFFLGTDLLINSDYSIHSHGEGIRNIAKGESADHLGRRALRLLLVFKLTCQDIIEREGVSIIME